MANRYGKRTSSRWVVPKSMPSANRQMEDMLAQDIAIAGGATILWSGMFQVPEPGMIVILLNQPLAVIMI